MNSQSRACTVVLACVLTSVIGAAFAEAHNWGCWRQPNRTVPAYVTAALSSQANAAVSEWDTKTILSVPRVGSHTEISVFDGYYGNTGWAGIASIESASGCNILHGHARVNRSYSYTSNGYRGIFCQEVGHLFGLDHSNDGGCMGGGYFYSINTYYTVVQHNITDIYNKYINSPAMMAGDAEVAALGPAPSEDSGFLSAEIPEGTARAVAFWHDRPNTMEEALERSIAVVRGRVLRVQPGADLVVPVEGLKDNVDRIPTERVLFAVDKVLAGQLNPRVVELFRTGSADYVIAEDPPYVQGESYVLFLTHADRGMYRTISPEGRLKVMETGLEMASSREFMSDLNGLSVDALSAEVARLSPTPGAPSRPLALQLRRNANPFTSRTSVSYALPEPADVNLAVFDAQGRQIRSLVAARQDGPRWYTVEWDGRDEAQQSAPNGVYFIRLVTPQGMKSVSVVRIN